MSDTIAAHASVVAARDRRNARNRARYLLRSPTERRDRASQILRARKKREASLTSAEMEERRARGRAATQKSRSASKAAESLQALGGGGNGEEAGRAGGVASAPESAEGKSKGVVGRKKILKIPKEYHI